MCFFRSDPYSTGATALKIKGGTSGIAMEDSNNYVFMRLKGGIGASMSIRADHESDRTATLLFGTPCTYDDNSLDKCAIIMEAATNYSRGNFYFC
jgi:hypothetical protein